MTPHPCILCAATAERRRPDPDDDVYEYDCPDCGRYSTKHAGTLIWPMALATDREAQIAAIKRVNAAGRRPLI